MATKPKHEGPHKYFQTQFKESGTLIFRCGLTNCPHFVYEPMILFRTSVCWRCGDNFIITKRSLKAKKMHCEGCTRFQTEVPIPKSLEHDVNRLLYSIEAEKEKKETEGEGKKE